MLLTIETLLNQHNQQPRSLLLNPSALLPGLQPPRPPLASLGSPSGHVATSQSASTPSFPRGRSTAPGRLPEPLAGPGRGGVQVGLLPPSLSPRRLTSTPSDTCTPAAAAASGRNVALLPYPRCSPTSRLGGRTATARLGCTHTRLVKASGLLGHVTLCHKL